MPERVKWIGLGYNLPVNPSKNRVYVWRKLKEMGAKLLITVDNGIAALEEAAYAAELGMDVVITDHHQPQEALPQAVAVVDPHRPDCGSACKD